MYGERDLMGIHVIQSQRIEVLVQGIITTQKRPTNNPFAVLQQQHFVVPSAAMQEWLTQRLSEHQGISANTFFHQRIRGFQWYAYQQILSDKDKVRKANIPRLIMKWRIFQALKPFIQRAHNQLEVEHPLFPLITRIYDSAARIEQSNEQYRKKMSMLYWVSDQVSKLFSNYMIYRADCRRACEYDCRCPENWIQVWGRNEALNIEQQLQYLNDQDSSFKFSQAQQLEAWQRWLWLNIFHEDFVEMQSIDHDFWGVLRDEQQQKIALKKLPQQLIVFTLLDLPPSQLQFLRRLGQYIDVLILHYNPSQEYWADSVDPNWKKQYDLKLKERYIEKFQQKHQRKPADNEVEQFFENFSLSFNGLARESRHPLLTRMGKQARDHFSLLSNLSSGDEGQWIDAFVDEAPQHLLSQLQSDILHLVEPQAQSYVLDPADDSIHIHVCHSAVRQLEVLKDQLTRWLAQSTAEAPRRPSDILVLAPDLKQIEPLIRSVFPQKNTATGVYLPVKLAGITQLDTVLAWRSVLGRIELIQSRFTIDDFADWLNLAATQVRYCLDINGTERILSLLRQAGFRRGLDEQHLQKTLAEYDQDYRFSFKYALDRLALGVAVPVHAMFEETLSSHLVDSGDFHLIATLIEIYKHFVERRDWLTTIEIENDQETSEHVEFWLNRLILEVNEFESAGVSSLEMIKEIIQKQIRMLTLATFYEEHDQAILKNIRLPLSYILTEIQSTLESQLDYALPTGQITFSQIGLIRPIPYKLIVMMNLDGGKFPNRESHLPFDLMDLLKPMIGDRSRLDDDQGAFLDALLLAKDNLWLFYNGFDVADGEVRDPSSSVQELLQHLAWIIKTSDQSSSNPLIDIDGIQVHQNLSTLYTVHPLQPFDPDGFQQQHQRYEDEWYAVASNLNRQDQRGHREAWINTTLELNQDIMVLDAEQWIKDICFPARLYLKTVGVSNLKDQDLPEVNEPLLLDGLARYSIRDFLQQQPNVSKLQTELLSDQLPVGKLQEVSLKMSLLEHQQLLKRQKYYIDEPTKITQRVIAIDDIHLQVTVPQGDETSWVSVSTSSARAQRRAHVWLEYLFWLSYRDLPDHLATEMQRIQIFSDKTIMCTGVTTKQAKDMLSQWIHAYKQAQIEPLVLPAALLMKLAVDGKALEWVTDEEGHQQLNNFDKLLNEWNKSDAFLSYSLNDSEESHLHRDWQYILQDLDAEHLLKQACDQFAYVLYQPIYMYQSEAEI